MKFLMILIRLLLLLIFLSIAYYIMSIESEKYASNSVVMVKDLSVKPSPSAHYTHTRTYVEAGDSILVLGKTDSKNILITSSITTILYQIAVGAAVVLRAF